MPTAQEAFKTATLFTDGRLYTVLRLPPSAIWAGAGVVAEIGSAFSALIADKDEVTLVLPTEEWQSLSERLPDHHALPIAYRLITFDLPLDPDIVGFFALVSQTLAAAKVPILACSSFHRDHVLVPAEAFADAWQALQTAQRA